ncbi:peptide/nickel transport system substrate-binding protein [Propionibacterium cyclohexanicum]|uniref:Peptide/nickel transport system substrate-binding protein n=1 Tax=Propionibacterium cyclohexanicum TaxID=64702 RepID=A0A1H9PZ35_9ACTN|nr:ABC transporter family substrate-binding protein [Propionibacterium cyclohexanicum]SER53408.1 peptide/nickel transport system substrate-binding protein [Propionibacterium cyclohexanicum]
MRTTRRLSLAATIAALALLASGCSSSASAGASQSPSASASAVSAKVDYNPQSYDNLKDGGTYTSGGSFSGDDTQGLPWNVNASLTGARIWAWYNPVAITFSPSGDVQINKDYYTDATSATVNGKQVVTITINPKASYNDGTPIDWHSIEATWKVNNGSNKNYKVGGTSGFDQIESVKRGIDDRQAVVTFAQPYSAWPALFARFINPEAASEDDFNNAYSNRLQPQWGAGPFTVESYDQNSKQIVFTRNPRWWGRTAKLDKRIYLDLGSQSAINAFKNGQIDYTGLSTAEALNQAKGTPGTEIRQGGSPFEYYLFANGRSEVLKDVDVRHAVFAAVNRAEIAQIEFQGLNYSEPLPGSSIYYGFQKGYQDNVSKVLSYSTDQAGQILDKAGWKVGSDGIRTKDGKALEVNYVLFGDDPLDKAVAQSLVASEKKAGIKVNIQATDSSEWASTINGGKFDLVLSGNRSLDPYGSYSLSGFYSSDSESNITGIGTPEIDQEIKRVNAIADPAEQIEQANAVEQKALALYGVLPLYSGPSTYAVKKGLANVGATIFYSPLPEEIGWQKGV